MNEKKIRWLAALMALALMLSLLAGCGGEAQMESEVPSPAQSEEAAPSEKAEPSVEPSEPEPSETPEPDPEPTDTPEPSLEPTPAPTPAPAQTGPEDGSYTANVTLAGGTGRASVLSPAT